MIRSFAIINTCFVIIFINEKHEYIEKKKITALFKTKNSNESIRTKITVALQQFTNIERHTNMQR